MAITSTPSNPFNNTPPVHFTDKNYADPFDIAALVAARRGLPQEILDQVHSDCLDIAKDSWLGFLDMFQMNIPFETDYVEFVETETPDYVIDDDGAVTRDANVFTIDPSAIEGYVANDDYFFFRVDDVISVYDNTGLRELGVITAVDKANDNFTAVCRQGAAWSGATTNITIDVTGGDHDRASCGPDGLLEHRRKKSIVLKLITIKDAMESTGGKRFGYCFDDKEGEYAWYDENTIKLKKRLNRKVAKALLLEEESVSGSGAHSAGKYGTKGLFSKLEEEALVYTGYVTTEAELLTITAYYDSLGFAGDKVIMCHVDNTQYRHFEVIAGTIANRLNINFEVVLSNTEDNFMKLGFKSLTVDGYEFRFAKWRLTEGNSPLGKNRVKDAMPKGIWIPMGTTPTMIRGEVKNVPYVFKAYQNMKKSPGMVRTFFTGAYANTPTNDCEYEKITKSTTVGIGVPCPESLIIQI